MDDKQRLIALAVEAQAKGGSKAPVKLLIDRLPVGGYTQNLRLYKTQGPWGKILRTTEEGTEVEFTAEKLLNYLRGKQNKLCPSTRRVQMHPALTRNTADQVIKLASAQKKTISEIFEAALEQYTQQLSHAAPTHTASA